MMKKWTKYDEKHFGDFSSVEQFGICYEDDEKRYTIGRFSNFQKDGLCIDKYADGDAIFAKYKNGQQQYPIIHISESGSLIAILGEEKNGSKYFFSYDEDDQSFLYQLDIPNEKDDPGIYFSGKDGTIMFSNIYTNEIEVIDRKFIPDRPIINKAPLLFPDKANFSKFEFRGDANYAVSENSLNERDPGIGVITWKNGHYCVGGWLDNNRKGYQIYSLEENDYFFFYGTVDIGGFYIRRINNDIFIKSVYSNKKEDNSFMVKFSDGVLSFSDINDKYLLSREGQGIEIPDINTINFVTYKNGNIDKIEQTFRKKTSLKKDNDSTVISKFGDIKVTATGGNQPDQNKKEKVKSDDPEYLIMNLVGQAEAKKEFSKIRAYLLKNDASSSYLNMLFTGGNGVGKSTFAKLLAKVLYKYNAIDCDDYYEVSAKELFSNFDGTSTQLIKSAYSDAKGGVFLIDDAKYLSRANNSGIKEAINTLANLMKEDPNTVFIFSDNKYNIDDLYENNKDVLEDKIRFVINFTDFSREELKEIIRENLKEKGYALSDDAMIKLLEIIYLAKSYGSEINATSALSIVEKLIVIQNVRTAKDDNKVIEVDDINTYISENDMSFLEIDNSGKSDARKKLDELIGLEKIKETIDDLISYFAMNRGKKVDCHMCFTGNPGTGKTEVARILGKLLRQEGILPTSKFVEVTRRDLVAEYVGQSAVKTREIIDKSMGGVLYIDEAYSLAYGGEKDFGREVVAELLKAMEDRRGEFVVILAGYTSEMKKLFDINPGFYSRIKFNLAFEDYNVDELYKIALLFLNREGYFAEDDVIKAIVKLVDMERTKPNFANVRTLREYLSRIQIKQASRIRKEEFNFDLNEKEIRMEDVIAVFGEEAVNEAIYGKKEVIVPKLDPQKLRDLYKDYPLIPFLEHKDLIEEVVVAIRTKGPESGESSGFFITNDGYIATCAHCVEGADSIEIRRRINHRGKRIDIFYQADIVSIDSKNDVAVIKVRPNSVDEEFDYVALAEPDYLLSPLSEIYEMGYPFGVSRFDEMTVNVGKIGSYQKGKDGEPDQINLDISAHGGNSGSLIVDAKTSRVIGTLTGASLAPHGEIIETIIFCRPISYIWAMLEKDFKK